MIDLQRFKEPIGIAMIVVSLTFACNTLKGFRTIYESNTLRIYALAKNTFVHVSYLDIPNYGRFDCNGLIFADKGEAIVFDTPSEDVVSSELINWIRNELNCKIVAVVINHFHVDCLGGLEAFHQEGAVSYANRETITLAKQVGFVLPQIGFDEEMEIQIGNKQAVTKYLGEGHTRDNVVSYIPSRKTLFGGCLIKEFGAVKGNLQDANVTEWSRTVRKVAEEFPELRTVVPGHGKPGGAELFNYTIELFNLDQKE